MKPYIQAGHQEQHQCKESKRHLRFSQFARLLDWHHDGAGNSGQPTAQTRCKGGRAGWQSNLCVGSWAVGLWQGQGPHSHAASLLNFSSSLLHLLRPSISTRIAQRRGSSSRKIARSSFPSWCFQVGSLLLSNPLMWEPRMGWDGTWQGDELPSAWGQLLHPDHLLHPCPSGCCWQVPSRHLLEGTRLPLLISLCPFTPARRTYFPSCGSQIWHAQKAWRMPWAISSLPCSW